MAIAVASVATQATFTGSGSFSIAKPSGLAEGDLLVAIVASVATEGVATPSGWTLIQDSGGSAFPRSVAFYKVADSSDVAASSFTFSPNSSAAGAGTLYRVTGAGASPVIDKQAIHQSTPDNSGGGVETFSVTIDSLLADGVVFMAASAALASGGGLSLSGHAITGGVSPTFTERMEAGSQSSERFSVADADYDDTTQITEARFTTSISSGSIDRTTVLVVLINPQADAEATPAVISLSAAPQAPTPSGDANVPVGSPATMSIAGQTPSAEAQEKTLVNEDKSAEGGVTNVGKS